MHGLVHRHLHKRKEAAFQDTFPAGFWIKFLDKIVLVAGVIGPLMVTPQIFKIYSTHNAIGVSALSWFAFALLDAPFVIYGVVHKDRPIVITYTLWLVANVIVGVGAIMYS